MQCMDAEYHDVSHPKDDMSCREQVVGRVAGGDGRETVVWVRVDSGTP